MAEIFIRTDADMATYDASYTLEAAVREHFGAHHTLESAMAELESLGGWGSVQVDGVEVGHVPAPPEATPVREWD